LHAFLCRGDDDAPVPRAEIDDEVFRSDAGEFEHDIHDGGRRRDVGRVGVRVLVRRGGQHRQHG
jgi:hypothetical protein